MIICVAIAALTIIVSVWLATRPFLLIVKKALLKLGKIDWGSFGSKTKTMFGKEGYSSDTEWFASVGKEIEEEKKKLDKSVKEIKKGEEKGSLDEKETSLAMRAVVDNYKSLVERQQNLLLEERGKSVRLEEELRHLKNLCSSYSKENEKLEIKIWQFRYLLWWHDFSAEEMDIVDGNIPVLEWMRSPEVEKKRKEIRNKIIKWKN
jgi:hypothetical protein